MSLYWCYSHASLITVIYCSGYCGSDSVRCKKKKKCIGICTCTWICLLTLLQSVDKSLSFTILKAFLQKSTALLSCQQPAVDPRWNPVYWIDRKSFWIEKKKKIAFESRKKINFESSIELNRKKNVFTMELRSRESILKPIVGHPKIRSSSVSAIIFTIHV